MTSTAAKDANIALVGIRLGASNIAVAYFKDGRSETVVNELGDRVTPTFITFTDTSEISIGLPSKQGLVRNQSNTIIWSPHFLEKRDDSDSLLRFYNSKTTIEVTENENQVVFSLTTDGKAKAIVLETAIVQLLNYVRQLVLSVTGAREVQAVLSMPYSMTQPHNQGLIRTCMKKSGIELHSIISDACSACLAYELDKDGGHVESHVLVYRLGGSTYECSILRTIGGCFQTLVSTSGFTSSGDSFTDLLTDIIAEEFQKKNKSDPRLSTRSLLKLRACAEQAKHVLSTTPVTQCSVDALCDGIDLDCNVSRLRLDGAANTLINDCLKPIDTVLEKAQLQADDIKLIVLCGGGTKIPKLRDAIQDKLANADMLSSINGDEVIALGAARQCYIESKYSKAQLAKNDNQFERVGGRYFRSHLITSEDQPTEISDSDGDDNDDEKENDDLDIDWGKHETYLRKLDLSDWKDQDHYRVLGLSKLRYKATQKQVRNAHKQMILRYHPDKSKRIESERFSLITHAFELLSNPAQRRAYDSIDPKFDDAVPNPTTSDNFYETFGPVFERNARWSVHQHVPLLGNDETSFEQVNKFYRFWYDFESWREYSYLDEEDKSQGQDRDERRFIEKQNRVERQKRKKTEVTRLRTLVDRACALDPRIKRQKKEEQQRKDDEKLRRKQEVDKKRQDQKQRELDEATRIAEEKQRIDDEAKRKQNEAKKEKEAHKKLIKKEKKQLRDLCKETNYFNDPASAPNLKQVEQIETLIEYLSVEDLKSLNEKLKDENADQRSIVLAEVKKMDEHMQEQSRIELAQQLTSSSSASSAATPSSRIKWTSDEIDLLVKSLRIYPAGVQNRWVVVQEYLKRSGGNPNRNVQDIMQKAKDVASGKKEVEESDSSLEHIVLNSHKQSTLQENQAKMNALTLTERDPDVPPGTPWTVDEQRIFEQALRTYPATLGSSRWDQITECLPSRSKKECLERYKELARIVQAKKATSTKAN